MKNIRNAYSLLHWLKTTGRENHLPTREMYWMVHSQREEIRRINGIRTDPIELSMRENWRRRYSDDGEYCTEYTLLPSGDWTDEDIREYIDSSVVFPPINSYYDCTGKPYTCYVYWNRTPAGVAMIHRWGLDV